MDTRHQVFLSSTYTDLIEPRRKVIEALLSVDAIPVGMEMFPAADQKPLDLIEPLIRASDYYVVLIGNRYGSQLEDGTSYTEREHEMALSGGVPVLAFLHGQVVQLPPHGESPDQQQRLDAFRAKLRSKLCKTFVSPDELGGQVIASLFAAKKSSPRPGWIRADKSGDPERIRELENEVERLRLVLAERDEIPGLAPVDDEIAIVVRGGYSTPQQVTVKMKWIDIFAYFIGPALLSDRPDHLLRDGFENFLKEQAGSIFGDPKISDQDWETIILQFVALGWIRQHPGSTAPNHSPWWQLMPRGRAVLLKHRVVKAEARPTPAVPPAGESTS